MNAQPAGRETDGRMEGEKGKREDMGKTKKPNAKGWKKRDEDGAGDGKEKKKKHSLPCGETLKPVRTRFPQVQQQNKKGGEPERDT